MGATGALAGRWVRIAGGVGEVERWLVASVRDDGRELQMDLDHSKMVTMQGTIEGIENERLIVTGVNFCDVILPGTPIRIGPVGDFSAPLFRIESAQQTGLPLRIGGTTTNMTPRTYYLGLERHGDLSAEDVGQPFWTCGIEIGDYVLME